MILINARQCWCFSGIAFLFCLSEVEFYYETFFNENVLFLFLATRAQNAGTPGHLVEVFV